MSLISIRFIKGASPYNAGDIAGFPDELAKRYVDAGIAIYNLPAVPSTGEQDEGGNKPQGAPEGDGEGENQKAGEGQLEASNNEGEKMEGESNESGNAEQNDESNSEQNDEPKTDGNAEARAGADESPKSKSSGKRSSANSKK